MSGYGAFSITAGALQLVVPSYGLRLVRRFGAQRAGWFLVTAFSSLALMHLVGPLQMTNSACSELMRDGFFLFGSVLLLVGMGHLETRFSTQEQTRTQEELLRSRWEYEAKREVSELHRVNEQLLQKLDRRDAAEKALRESEARHRFLFEENPQPMWIMDVSSGRLISANKAGLSQLGFSLEEFIRLTIEDLLMPESVNAFRKAMAEPLAGGETGGVWPHLKKDRTLVEVELVTLDFEVGGSRVRLVLARDVTRQHQRDLEIRKAEKMELAGEVAGGVALHFNGLLNSIEENTAQLLSRISDAEAAGQLRQVSLAATRGKNLTYQLLAASGKQLVQFKPVDLNGLIRNLNLILRRLAGEQVEFQNTCGACQLPILGDPRVIESMIIHLVNNARFAMPSGGTLTLSTAVLRMADPRDPQGAAKEFVRLTVRDTGCGMSSAVQKRVFEPFFTARETAKGMGLGLASIYGAMKQHWGKVEFTSQEKKGSEFRLYFPCAPELMAGLGAELQIAAAPASRGTVLLVEPEDRVRGTVRHVLNRHGYRVVEADGSAIALMLWEGQAQNITTLIISMGFADGTSGLQLARRLRELKPELKVLYAVEGETDSAKRELTPTNDFKVIGKPYTPTQLLQSLEDFFGSRC